MITHLCRQVVRGLVQIKPNQIIQLMEMCRFINMVTHYFWYLSAKIIVMIRYGVNAS
jgi:hypothetical protein